MGTRAGQIEISRQHMDAFCAGLAEGLHAIAQPLTIVRNELCPAKIEELSIESLRESLKSSAIEIERICGYFNILKQMVATERYVAETEDIEASTLVSEAVDGVDRLFEEHGIILNISPITSPLPLKCNHKRARQSVSMLLVAICSLSKNGQEITIETCDGAEHISIVIGNSDLRLKRLDAHNSLLVSLVDSILRGQAGKLLVEVEPIRFRLQLRKVAAAVGAAGI